jgi:two-component SAPR family response regulator
MCIVAVDADSGSLEELKRKLAEIFEHDSVAAFTSPLEALKFAESNKIDLLFTDVRLRPFDGYELIKALRQKQSFYAYIVSGTKEHPDDLGWMNVNGYLSKPVSLGELTEIKNITAC